MDQQTLIPWLSLAFVVLLQAVGFAFALGRLFEKVRAHSDKIAQLEKGETDGEGGLTGLRVEFAEFRGAVTARLDSQSDHIDSLQRTIEGQSRQLSNLMTGQFGRAVEIPAKP